MTPVITAAVLLGILGLSAWAERTEIGPPVCAEGCQTHGTCGEDGNCRCPFGRTGDACEDDVLAPCRQAPDGIASCGDAATKSCECLERCHDWFCRHDAAGQEWCHWFYPPEDRACYLREGVPPEHQFSRIPEPDETNVKCYRGYREGAEEVPCSDAMVWPEPWEKTVSLPLSRCQDSCNQHGYCMRAFDEPEDAAGCRCHRGYEGHQCEVEEPMCFNNCSGRGKCVDHFCHCEPPFFSLDCSRSQVFPANFSMPHPTEFKIYMYELPTWLAYENSQKVWHRQHNPIYIAYYKFLEQFLGNPVRTEDPSEAHLFYVPALAFSYTGNQGHGTEHMHLVIDYISQHYPYWNRTGGRDHFFWAGGDYGACELGLEAMNAIKIVHYGLHTTPERHSPTVPHKGHPDYGCFHPLRDVVANPYDPIDATWLANTTKLRIDKLLQLKTRTFFFAGGILPEAPEYSGNSRQTVYQAVQEWKDPAFVMYHSDTPEGFDYGTYMRSSKFCLCPSGWGWGTRLLQAMLAGCVPVIVQEHSLQAHEDVLPYEDFSVRLANADLPYLRDILNGISDQQYGLLLRGVLRHQRAFAWDPQAGGRAFDFTIASLRRRHLNFKTLLYGEAYRPPGGAPPPQAAT